MHRTDIVPELAGRRSISLVARSKKLKLSSPRASHAHLPSGRLINLSRADNALVIGIVPNSSKLVGRSTSPRVYSTRWSVQAPDLQSGGLGDQSSSIQCSVVGADPRSPIWRTGQPVPEHTVLGGRCSPHISNLADWATSPRAYSARWSVQSPDLLSGRLGDQSSSIQCSVVGAVRRNVHPPPIFVCYFEKKASYHINE